MDGAVSRTLVLEPEGNSKASSSGPGVDVDSVCRKWPPWMPTARRLLPIEIVPTEISKPRLLHPAAHHKLHPVQLYSITLPLCSVLYNNHAERPGCCSSPSENAAGLNQAHSVWLSMLPGPQLKPSFYLSLIFHLTLGMFISPSLLPSQAEIDSGACGRRCGKV